MAERTQKLELYKTKLGEAQMAQKDNPDDVRTFEVYYGNVLKPDIKPGKRAKLSSKAYKKILQTFLSSPEGETYIIPTIEEIDRDSDIVQRDVEARRRQLQQENRNRTIAYNTDNVPPQGNQQAGQAEAYQDSQQTQAQAQRNQHGQSGQQAQFQQNQWQQPAEESQYVQPNNQQQNYQPPYQSQQPQYQAQNNYQNYGGNNQPQYSQQYAQQSQPIPPTQTAQIDETKTEENSNFDFKSKMAKLIGKKPSKKNTEAEEAAKLKEQRVRDEIREDLEREKYDTVSSPTRSYYPETEMSRKEKIVFAILIIYAVIATIAFVIILMENNVLIETIKSYAS